MEQENLRPIAKIAAALSKAQGKISSAKKDSVNSHFNSKYATLASIWDACRGPLSENEIAVVQAPEIVDERLILRTTFMHSSGETLECLMPISVPQTATAQQLGSAMTYARKYSLATMAGVAPDDDDDGNAATEAKPIAPQKPVTFWDKSSYELPVPKPITEQSAKAWVETFLTGVAKAPNAESLAKYQADNQQFIDSLHAAMTHEISERCKARFEQLEPQGE